MVECTGRDLKDRFFKYYSNTDREAQSVLRFLLSSILNCDYSEVNFHLNEAVSSDQVKRFEHAFNRLKTGEPIQHIVGMVEFFDLTIEVSDQVLIPRPETEELLYWIKSDECQLPQNAIDLCTGSGCIALGLKSIFPMARVEGVDLSETALQIAKRNANQNKLEVDFYLFDVLNPKETRTPTYDLIVSNPPYIPIREKEGMDAQVVNFEPNMALFVENHQPLIFYERIGQMAQKLLTKEGAIYLELHENFALETLALYRALGFSDVVLKKDLQGKNRMLRVRR